MDDFPMTKEIAMLYRSPSMPLTNPGSFIVPRIKSDHGEGYIFHALNEIGTQKISKLINMKVEPLAIQSNLEEMTGAETEYIEVTGVEHDSSLEGLPYYSTAEKFGDKVYERVPMQLSVADAIMSSNGCEIRIPKEYLMNWDTFKRNALNIFEDDPEYESLVRKNILFRNTGEMSYRLSIKKEKKKNYKDFHKIEKKPRFTKIVNPDGSLLNRNMGNALVMSDGETSFNFVLKEEKDYEPGNGFNVGEKLHNEISFLKEKMDDNGIKVDEIYYDCFLGRVNNNRPSEPMYLNGGSVVLSNEDGKKSDMIYVGNNDKLASMGDIAANHKTRLQMKKTE